MEKKKINVIITGATGMVGEGVLHECINSDYINKIMVVGRRSCGLSHSKIEEIVLSDMMNVSSISEKFKEYDACFFCMGSTSLGKSDDEYYHISYTIPMEFGKVMSEINPQMYFLYISGAGTDSTETGKIKWARVKGKTENDLMKLPFKRVFAFRPGYLHPTQGLKNTLSFYKYIKWSFPIMKLIMPNKASTLAELGKAMINSVIYPYSRQIIEVKDILKLSKLS